MPKIIPNIEAYGTYARPSAIADTLEIQALRGSSMTLPELADYIQDNGWTKFLKDRFQGPREENGELDSELDDVATLGEEADASDAAARSIFNLIRERADILGNDYPYAISGGRLNYRGDPNLQSWYLLFLCVTIAHAYGVPGTSFNPRHYFEDLVTVVLASRGLLVGNLGRVRRSASNFEEALDAIGEICGLSPTIANATIRRNAQEEGVDVVAHLSWQDSRPIHWVFLVQATCEKSDGWYKKMQEPSEGMWQKLLALKVLPRAVLAVPHHVPTDMLSYLTERASGSKLVMDRLGLCRSEYKEPLDQDMKAALNMLREVSVDFG